MSASEHLLAPASPLPGWYGKLPGMGDFAHRRMPEYFLSTWDHWLQDELQGLRHRRQDWVERYLQGPLWFFALGPGVAGPHPWLGIMMPSVDAAGRYFPLTLATEMRATDEQNGHRCWDLSAQVAMTGLDQDMDATRFEQALHAAFEGCAAPEADGPLVRLPEARQSHWLLNPRQDQPQDFYAQDLPKGAAFDALFGCVHESSPRAQELVP